MERPPEKPDTVPTYNSWLGALAKHEARYIGRNAFVSSLSNHES
ncbi:hypothetical protein CBM2631_P320002 [Cupriavidus taiwanensis]|nr:hypothetical protein CBM2585_P320003 [Cupriavidus taiwanensis]SOZ90614.1 hypothetical protein CBM2618_P330003 [Cupriavidus taiwanensis]SPA21640.1 hypothetical protein CBM2631_P320002 [Cupriavidus taiwanensis]SPD37554.1 protein of unknown function [Cupriavidus taiwanensis]